MNFTHVNTNVYGLTKHTFDATGSGGGAESMTDGEECAVDLKFTKPPQYLFHGVPMCVMREYPCYILFLVGLFQQKRERFGKKKKQFTP